VCDGVNRGGDARVYEMGSFDQASLQPFVFLQAVMPLCCVGGRAKNTQDGVRLPLPVAEAACWIRDIGAELAVMYVVCGREPHCTASGVHKDGRWLRKEGG